MFPSRAGQVDTCPAELLLAAACVAAGVVADQGDRSCWARPPMRNLCSSVLISSFPAVVIRGEGLAAATTSGSGLGAVCAVLFCPSARAVCLNNSYSCPLILPLSLRIFNSSSIVLSAAWPGAFITIRPPVSSAAHRNLKVALYIFVLLGTMGIYACRQERHLLNRVREISYIIINFG